MPDPEDVQPGSSPGEQSDPTVSPDPAPSAVTEDVTGEETVDGRPLKNIQAEWNRKYGELGQRLDLITTLLTQRMLPQEPVTPAPAAPAQHTDEQLAQYAAAGHAWAAEQLTERKASRAVDQRMKTFTQQMNAAQMLNAIMGRTPALHDQSSPLFRAAMAEKVRLMSQGQEDSDETRLRAVQAAISLHPELAQPVTPAAPTTSRTPVQTQQTIDASGRRPAQSSGKSKVKLTAQHIELARRYGVKDPEKAIENFQRRQDKGQSRLGSVAAFVKEEW